MSDLISRQAAIDAILHNQEVYSNNFGDDPIDKYTVAIIDNDAQTIAQLPPVQPELDEWCTDCKEYDHDRGSCPRWNRVIRTALADAQPDNDMIHLQKEQAYWQGWEEGREALRKEIWEDGRDRLD